MAKKDKQIQFEEAFKRLEDIVTKMESGDFTLREKQHLPFEETKTLGWLQTAGKVKRVGLSHLWSRW